MSTLWTSFPTEVDPAALQIVWDATRGIMPDKVKATLCAFNVAAYAAYQIEGQPKMSGGFGATSMSDDEAFEKAIAHCNDPATFGASAMTMLPWLTIFKAAIKILAMFAA
jgi:hypothetical protein